MPNTSKSDTSVKLDKKDRRILFELDRNSRQSINDLAKKTRLSRDVVAYRIKQLEKSNIINSYITIIDFTKFGHSIVRLYLRLQDTTEQLEQEMASYFLKEKNIITIYRTDGPFDLAIGFLVKDLRDFQKARNKFMKKYRRYISDEDFSILTDFLHYNKNFLVDKQHHDNSMISTGSHQPYDLDKKDMQLLKELSENARISLLELSKKLNITPTGVKYKLKNLEKNKVIVAYKLLADFRKLGFEYYKVDIDVEDLSIIPSLHEFTLQHPNITYRDITVGGRDFEIDGEFKSQADFYSFMNTIKNMFPNKIRNYFYYRALKIYKYSYFPE